MRPLNSEFESASTAASRNRGSSKAISGRILTKAGIEPHPITKSVWKWTNRCTLLSIVACAAYVAVGDDRAFQANHVSKPHRVFEKKCSLCHTTWGPAERIVATFTGKNVYSINNQKCEACHAGGLHHENQWPLHTPLSEELDPRGVFLSCAKCHREHRGDVNVAESANQHCVDCHANLPKHAYPDLSNPAWAKEVTSFYESGGHPEFALLRRLAGDSDVPPPPVLEKFVRSQALLASKLPDEAKQPTGDRWQDPGRIRFNHYAHLGGSVAVVDDDESRERWGDRVEWGDKKSQSVALECKDCHQPDDAGRYMQPINYESHCRICHAVRFDLPTSKDENKPAAVAPIVPHGGIAAAARDARGHGHGKEEPEVGPGIELLIAYLSEHYTEKAVREQMADVEGEPDDLAKLFGVPGRSRQSILTAKQKERVRGSVNVTRNKLLEDISDEQLKGYRQELTTLDSCRFCHEVDGPNDSLRITPTKIPERWMPHGKFDHSRHRMLQCGECHTNPIAEEGFREVEKSFDTGDVLMPTIGLCRQCHTPHPSRADLGSARSDCVECHRYHDHSSDPIEMGLDLRFQPIEK